jgi:hypothetical protein
VFLLFVLEKRLSKILLALFATLLHIMLYLYLQISIEIEHWAWFVFVDLCFTECCTVAYVGTGHFSIR